MRVAGLMSSPWLHGRDTTKVHTRAATPRRGSSECGRLRVGLVRMGGFGQICTLARAGRVLINPIVDYPLKPVPCPPQAGPRRVPQRVAGPSCTSMTARISLSAGWPTRWVGGCECCAVPEGWPKAVLFCFLFVFSVQKNSGKHCLVLFHIC